MQDSLITIAYLVASVLFIVNKIRRSRLKLGFNAEMQNGIGNYVVRRDLNRP